MTRARAALCALAALLVALPTATSHALDVVRIEQQRVLLTHFRGQTTATVELPAPLTKPVLVATPEPPLARDADAGVFSTLDEAAAPRVENDWRLRRNRSYPGNVGCFAPPAAVSGTRPTSAPAKPTHEPVPPLVPHPEVQTPQGSWAGDVSVVPVRASSGEALLEWAASNDLGLAQSNRETLSQHVESGGAVSLVRPTSGDRPQRVAVRLTFASPQPMAPVVFPTSRDSTMHLRTYLLTDHRARTATPDTPRGPDRGLEFAGRITPLHAELRAVPGTPTYLTVLDVPMGRYPEEVAARFTRSPNDTPFRDTRRECRFVTEEYPWALPAAGAFLVALAVGGTVGVHRQVKRRGRRSGAGTG